MVIVWLMIVNKMLIIFWLVVSTYPSEKYEFVSWDEEIPNIWKLYTLWHSGKRSQKSDRTYSKITILYG